MVRWWVAGWLLIVGAWSQAEVSAADAKRPMTLEDLFRLHRVANPQVSPDGRWVVYQLTDVDLAANRTTTALWLAATDGRTLPRPLTHAASRNINPRWSPDSSKIVFESNRDGSQQLYVLDLKNGGEAQPITRIATEAANPIWSPDGSHIAFVSAVFPEFSHLPFEQSDRKNQERLTAQEQSPVKARVFTKLFYRHWVEYVGDRRQHLFVCRSDGSELRDVTPGDRDAYPTSTTFSSGDDFTFSPDGRYLIFTAVPEKNEAWSTNYDLCRVSITNRSAHWECLTRDNPAADSGPRFSPDGKKLAWRAQKQPGYEADKWDIVVADCQPDGSLASTPRPITAGVDRSANEFVWKPRSDGQLEIYYTADSAGSVPIFGVNLNGQEALENRGQRGMAGSLSASRNGGVLTFTLATMTSPPEVFSLGSVQSHDRQPLLNLSKANDLLLDELDRPRPESVQVPVEGGVKMQMWILKPPGFDARQKWPVAYLVHGGPQGAWEDGWSWRWNPLLWASQGYVVVLPNPRGSTGFGQKFTDEITGDWGGKCYRDLVAGLNYVEKLPYVDPTRMAAAGASFGGYMMNWFAVNDIAPRFRCLITHCSVWNFESMWGTTDELWFDEWEHGGLPWEKPHKYREFSPHVRAAELGKHRVPTLVIHNDLDFRCPIGQGHELFAALQRQGVPSRFVNFPDEGHWVLKPKNSEYWHQEVFGWLKRHVPPGGR